MKWLYESAYIFNIFVNKIKITFSIILLIISPIQSFCQADSILNKIINSSHSKLELIKKGSDQILYCLSIKDIPGATQIRDYMLSDVEDSLYVAFDSYNYPLILYRMQDYDDLIKYYLHFDSLEVLNKHKIKPNDSELYLNLAWSLPEVAKYMFKSIKKSNLSREYKEVLILDLHKRTMEVDGGDYILRNYYERVTQFKNKYPNSRLKDYVEKHIQHGNSWD